MVSSRGGACIFSPDGKTILTGSEDKTARLWRVPMSLEYFLEKGKQPLQHVHLCNDGIHVAEHGIAEGF